jgi:hypothetical protein
VGHANDALYLEVRRLQLSVPHQSLLSVKSIRPPMSQSLLPCFTSLYVALRMGNMNCLARTATRLMYVYEVDAHVSAQSMGFLVVGLFMGGCTTEMKTETS